MKKTAGLIIVALVVSVAFAGCAAKGEKLWEKACGHMLDTIAADASKGDRKGLENGKEDLQNAMKACVAPFGKMPAEVADEAANCVLGETDKEGFGRCMDVALKKQGESDDKNAGKEKKPEEK